MKRKSLLLLFTLFVIAGKSQTTVPGGSVSGTWTLAGSPYLVQGSIMVPNGSTLTIDPGVTVNFQGHYKLYVQGKVLAQGNATDSIYFTAASTSTGWYGVRFDNTPVTNDTSRFSYCSFRWGNANGTGDDASGGTFMFNNFSKGVIDHCLIRNSSASTTGYQAAGGAIFCDNGSPVISNNSILLCAGGISSTGTASPEITGNTISYNNGIAIIRGFNGPTLLDVNITNNLIYHNTGTGIQVYYSSGTISGNTVSYNSTGSYTNIGGIWCDNSVVNISNNVISYNGNITNGYAGGIFSYFSGCNIFDNIIVNNSSGNGGGIRCVGQRENEPNTISNNVIANNVAAGVTSGFGYGGAIGCENSCPVLENNTICNNTAIYGGGISCSQPPDSTTVIMRDCIFYGNAATTEGPQVYLRDEQSDPVISYCDIQGGSGAFGTNGNFYTGAYTNNIDADPAFVSASGGSGTGFNGLSANWSLQTLSPCIDAGNPSGSYPTMDIAGYPRVSGLAIDIGAYEQLSMSVGEINDAYAMSIYPNPSSDRAVITYNVIKDVKLSVYITNMMGQKMAVLTDENTAAGQKTINIDVKELSLAPGIYFVVLEGGGMKDVKKLVVSK